MRLLFISACLCLSSASVLAQADRWQQRVQYNIDVRMDVDSNRMSGQEKITYWNNSPDTLRRMFIHLYWNAFQPNSMMDQRSRHLGNVVLGYDKNNKPVTDWDSRVKDRILHLQPNEIGYQRVQYVKIAGQEQKLTEHETILEVTLTKPLLPNSQTQLDIAFQAQVPLQVRRSGRDNAEGIRYSMSQWYPKIAEYDYQGWNANPYIAREFHGVWGDYNVNISINKKYKVAATGTLISDISDPKSQMTVWRFSANTVHDFLWAADTAYKTITRKPADGPVVNVVYKKVDSLERNWQVLADTMALIYPYMAKTFGPYPWKSYTFIQGGDGGMEYPMATLIKNAGIGTAIHEWMHSWYQGMMATNESLYPWMDEGFTSYADARIQGWMRKKTDFWWQGAYDSYFRLVKSGREEPMSTHADHYNTNYAYGIASYGKGAVFLAQLGYIVGDAVLDQILLEYYRQYKFRHPDPNDFIRVAEKVSGMELQWYKEYWVYTTKTIDYGVGNVNLVNGKAQVTLKRMGDMPMPVDVLVTYKDGTQELHYVPMNLMYGSKSAADAPAGAKWVEHPEWKWTQNEYPLELGRNLTEIRSVVIDASSRLADVNRGNNSLVVPE